MNDKLIQIGGKSYKECEVVMLPTNDQTQIAKGHDNNRFIYADKPMSDTQNNRAGYMNQHLYILSSEEIKEGDWVYDVKNNQIDRYTSSSIKEEIKYFKKIISTTDKDIFLPNFHYRYSCLRPSDDFIKAFVKAQGKIDKVLVEYEKLEEPTFDGNSEKYAEYALKVAKDNTVTIRAIQEEKIDIIDLAEIELKSYVNPSEEFKDAFIAGVTTGYYHKNKEAIHTWIDKGIDVFSGEKTSWSREEVIRFAEKYARMVQEKPIQLNAYKTIHNNKWIEENL